MRLSNAIAAALGFLLAVATVCSAASYSVIDLGTLGGTDSQGFGINASGQVTGFAYTAGESAKSRAFLYDGTMHDLGTLGGLNSIGQGINDSGEVTGISNTSAGTQHAFLYDGTMHDLGTFGGAESIGYAINASGEVTGYADTRIPTLHSSHAFLYDGTMHDLGTLGGDKSEGHGINATGQVTGTSYTTGNAQQDAFLYDATMHDLGTLGGRFAVGNAINASGQVAGSSKIAGDVFFHAFLYDGTMHDLGTLGESYVSSEAFGINASGFVTGDSSTNRHSLSDLPHAFLYDGVHGMVDLNLLIDPSSGWFLEQGDAINDLGQITGIGRIGGQDHAFLLTPTPEPSTIVLAVAGFAGVIVPWWRRRARRLAQSQDC